MWQCVTIFSTWLVKSTLKNSHTSAGIISTNYFSRIKSKYSDGKFTVVLQVLAVQFVITALIQPYNTLEIY